MRESNVNPCFRIRATRRRRGTAALMAAILGLCAAMPGAAWARDEATHVDTAPLRRALRQGTTLNLGNSIQRATEGASLLTLARIAFRATQFDELDTLRVKIEDMEAAGKASNEIDLAVGFTSLGLARAQIADESLQGSDIVLLLADAVQRAEKVLAADTTPISRVHQLGLLLIAETRLTEGKLAGLEAVQAHAKLLGTSESKPPRIPELDAYETMLLYARATGRPAKNKRLSEAAQEELTRVLRLCRTALQGMSGSEMLFTPKMREDVQLREAWTHHRLAHFDEAESAYGRAWSLGSKESDRPRVYALRGLASLYANHPDKFDVALTRLHGEQPMPADVAKTLIESRMNRNALGPALLAAQKYAASSPGADASILMGRVFQAMQQWHEAQKHYEAAHKLDPKARAPQDRLEWLARAMVGSQPERAVAIYESVLAMRPSDILLHNNVGFFLRELVTPHTEMLQGGRQRLHHDAPPHARAYLRRCVEVYRAAVALIDPALDGERELEVDWDLAGIINDLALMLHYFEDVEAPLQAEALYHRALKMTDYGFKDTYSPNIQRLYRHVLKDRTYTWWRTAKTAKDAILVDTRDEQGRVEFVPDERKRAAATRDEAALRAQLLRELGADDDDR